ncbi:MAG: hypothetical protein KKE86_04200 [Planctomycetes bacterium]|nr:hypothetical protein [Planctomycetota bacterium]MBU4398520.1 hypothetical protein [Planctomycetota bacterium]MCG2684812.1 hypothetical protein [Planctomycetales bacterium]
MIAFIRPPEESPRRSPLRRVHGLLGAALLPPRTAPPAGDAPPIAGWKAWLFAGWLLAVAAWAGLQAVAALF